MMTDQELADLATRHGVGGDAAVIRMMRAAVNASAAALAARAEKAEAVARYETDTAEAAIQEVERLRQALQECAKASYLDEYDLVFMPTREALIARQALSEYQQSTLLGLSKEKLKEVIEMDPGPTVEIGTNDNEGRIKRS